MDDETARALKEAADAYERASSQLELASKALRRAILDAGRRERPADITRVIRYLYTYDYVARLIREGRKES
jgi:hypothetical protein